MFFSLCSNILRKSRKTKARKQIFKDVKYYIKKLTPLNYDSLKFEYYDICQIVDNEINKIKSKNSNLEVSELYLVKMHINFCEVCKNESISEENRLLELFASFCDAVIFSFDRFGAPIFLQYDDYTGAYDCSKCNLKHMDARLSNKLLLENIIEAIEQRLLCDSIKISQYYHQRYMKTQNYMYINSLYVYK